MFWSGSTSVIAVPTLSLLLFQPKFLVHNEIFPTFQGALMHGISSNPAWPISDGWCAEFSDEPVVYPREYGGKASDISSAESKSTR